MATREERDDLLSNLRSPMLLARHPLIGVLMVLLGILVFGLMAINLQTGGPLIRLDEQLNNSLHATALQSPPLIRGVMIFGYYFGQEIVVGVTVLSGLYFLYKRYWPELIMVAIALPGEGTLWLLISDYFKRPRPVFDTPVWHHMTAPGFPSGHVFAALLIYGLIAYFVVPRMPTRLRKAAVIVAILLVILFAGFSRLFVGDHYLTDVLAGYALGIAWAGLVYTTVEVIAWKRGRHKTAR